MNLYDLMDMEFDQLCRNVLNEDMWFGPLGYRIINKDMFGKV